jgi:hypothetical protein
MKNIFDCFERYLEWQAVFFFFLISSDWGVLATFIDTLLEACYIYRYITEACYIYRYITGGLLHVSIHYWRLATLLRTIYASQAAWRCIIHWIYIAISSVAFDWLKFVLRTQSVPWSYLGAESRHAICGFRYLPKFIHKRNIIGALN